MKNPVIFFKDLHPETQSRIATGLLILATVVGLVGLFNPNFLILLIVVIIYVIAVMMVQHIRKPKR